MVCLYQGKRADDKKQIFPQGSENQNWNSLLSFYTGRFRQSETARAWRPDPNLSGKEGESHGSRKFIWSVFIERRLVWKKQVIWRSSAASIRSQAGNLKPRRFVDTPDSDPQTVKTHCIDLPTVAVGFRESVTIENFSWLELVPMNKHERFFYWRRYFDGKE